MQHAGITRTTATAIVFASICAGAGAAPPSPMPRVPLPPLVIDSRGQFVGYVQFMNTFETNVVLNLNGRGWAWASLKDDGTLNSSNALYFASSDCSGTPYLRGVGAFGLAHIGTAPNSSLSSVYFGRGTGRFLNVFSYWDSSCHGQFENFYFFEATGILMTDLRWVPPYRIAPASTR